MSDAVLLGWNCLLKSKTTYFWSIEILISSVKPHQTIVSLSLLIEKNISWSLTDMTPCGLALLSWFILEIVTSTISFLDTPSSVLKMSNASSSCRILRRVKFALGWSARKKEKSWQMHHVRSEEKPFGPERARITRSQTISSLNRNTSFA